MSVVYKFSSDSWQESEWAYWAGMNQSSSSFLFMPLSVTRRSANQWSDPHRLLSPSGLSCTPVLPPRRGSFYVETGTGVSIGSVLAFWCREGYQLVGSDKIYCNVRNGKPQWSNYLPVCEGKCGFDLENQVDFSGPTDVSKWAPFLVSHLVMREIRLQLACKTSPVNWRSTLSCSGEHV